MYAHNQHIGKSNNLGLWVLENKGPKQISKIGYGHLCLREKNLSYININNLSKVEHYSSNHYIWQDGVRVTIFIMTECTLSNEMIDYQDVKISLLKLTHPSV